MHLCRGRSILSLSLAVAAWLLTALAAVALPEGRAILRNGDFRTDEAGGRPAYWLTRDNANHGKFTLTPPAEDQKSGVLGVEVLKSSPSPWALELRQGLAAPIQKGETLYFTFEYKMTPGYAFHCYWQKDSPPWDKLLSLRIAEPADRWTKCAMALRVQADLQPRQTSVSFHLAEQTGTVQFRNFAITAYPASVDPEELPTTYEPILGGDFHDNNWRTKVKDRISALRKADLRIRVVRGGKALSGPAVVRVQQKARAFLFGTEVSAPFLSPDLLKQPRFADYRKAVEGVEGKLPDYRKKVLDPRLFNLMALRDVFTWRDHEEWGEAVAADLMALLRPGGTRLRGGPLYRPAFRFLPSACRQMDREDLKRSIQEHVTRMTGKYRGTIAQWDVLYGAITFEEVYNVAGEASLVNAFKAADKGDPEAHLVFRDDRALMAPSAERTDEMLALVKWLRGQGARLDALALDAPMTRPYIAPQAIEERLDQIATATQLPLVITAVGVESSKEKLQADRLSDLLILFYSHPAVTTVCLSSIWDVEMPDAGSALFRRDFTAKPAGKTLERLLTEEWWTDSTSQTDPDGILSVSAFIGDYEITAEAGGAKTARTVTLIQGGADVILDLAPASPAEAPR